MLNELFLSCATWNKRRSTLHILRRRLLSDLQSEQLSEEDAFICTQFTALECIQLEPDHLITYIQSKLEPLLQDSDCHRYEEAHILPSLFKRSDELGRLSKYLARLKERQHRNRQHAYNRENQQRQARRSAFKL